MNVQLREHTFLGVTQSLCPECLALVPAKIIVKGTRVYFRKTCATHGVREDFVCSDVSQYDQMQYSLPGKVPPEFGVAPERGCPYDCGLCTEHEQHTCVGLAEITSACNLQCPMCFASSGPGGRHLSFAEAKAQVDRLVEVEGRAEVLQITGGEPTIHPEFLAIVEYAAARPIDIVMINTNGIRLARDPALLDAIERLKHRVEIYLQFDGFSDRSSTMLRGESLVETKLKAIERLGERGIKTTLVATLQPDVNDHEIGAIIQFGIERPWITGVSLQPATYSGRYVLPEQLERRVTFPDVIRAVAGQTSRLFREDDFMPLPCAHPNCHSLTYAFRQRGQVIPLTRFIDARKHLDILANGILFSRNRARQLIEHYLAKVSGCGVGCSPAPGANGQTTDDSVERAASEFFRRALAEQLSQSDVFRITITSFLDAYNFDVRRLMKCCIHHVLPSGHVIPFCAYNVLYREGHVALPALREAGILRATVPSRDAALI